MPRILRSLLLAVLLVPLAAAPAAALSPDQPAAPVDLSPAQAVLIFAGIPLLVAGLVWALVSLPGTQGSETAGLQGPLNEGPFWVNPPAVEGAAPAALEAAAVASQGGAGARW